MNLLFRILSLLLSRFLWPKNIKLTDKCITHFRVWPTDLDMLGHMNNGIYLSIMDVARADLQLRSGYFWRLYRKGVYAVVASEGIRFRRSLKLFQPFRIETVIDGIDDRYFYIRQIFLVGKNDVIAEAVIKGRFIHRGQGPITIAETFGVLNEAPPHLPVSQGGQRLSDLDELLARGSKLVP